MTECNISIPEFFRDKNIFITGGSGFIGKVLVEKLLRSCPDVGNLYLLMRPKKGKTEQERIQQITNLPLYDRLRKEHPENLSKIKIVSGDLLKLDLNLSPADRDLLVDKVNIIFHGAASVRFDDSLEKAIKLNTRGTREVITLALQMPNLEVLNYISTTYCQTDKAIIEEKLYPACVDWRTAIKIAEKADLRLLNVLEKKYIGQFPNTYTFTKSMSEQMIDDLCRGKIPAVIVRPSIVISSIAEPMPGWVDNFNGPVGILIGCAKGVVRTMYTNPNIAADYVPVDFVSKSLLVSVWKRSFETTDQVSVYNMSNNKMQTMTFADLIDVGKDLAYKFPFHGVLFFPDGYPTSNWYDYMFRFYFFQLLPALLVDGILKLLGRKTLLMKIQRTIYTANLALEYFVTNEWQFVNEKLLNLQPEILPNDRPDFCVDYEKANVVQFFIDGILGSQKYLMKEKNKNVEHDRNVMKILWVLLVGLHILCYTGLFWLIYVKFDLISILIGKYNDTVVYFNTV